MITTTTLLLTLAQAAGAPAQAEPIQVSAYLDADELVVGEAYTIQLELEMAEGLAANKAGGPAPFLQIDVPPSVRLAGDYLETDRELQRNDYIMEPYERLLKDLPAGIEFELVAEPGADETIGLNLMAYVSGPELEPMFVRQRIEVPVKALADGKQVPATNSTWGVDEKLLQIGSKVEGLELPRADGSLFNMDDWLGEKNIIVTTYRAHW